MNRRSSFRNSKTRNEGLIIKRSTSAMKKVEEVAATATSPAPRPPLLANSQSTKFTQRSHSHSHSHSHNHNHSHNHSHIQSLGNHEHDHHNLQVSLHKKTAEPVVEFPVSPEADAVLVSEGITNANHPQHKMVQVNLPNPFICMGCKEYGAGSRITCQQCNFELHDFCALAPPVLKAHPLHSQHQLEFDPKPGKGGFSRSKCDVCGKSTKGYIFRCSACSFQLHPCCAMLSGKVNFQIHPHSLVILPVTANPGSAGDMLCSECKKRRSGRVYQCTVCDYHLHAVCAKSMVNGLHANGIKGLENPKPSKFSVAAKIASHVVVGFMGGLVEGIGEGLGEALTQNFVKGRCNSYTRRSSYPGYPGN